MLRPFARGFRQHSIHYLANKLSFLVIFIPLFISAQFYPRLFHVPEKAKLTCIILDIVFAGDKRDR